MASSAQSKIKPGDRFRDENGVWIVDGPARGVPGAWEIYLVKRGRGHSKVEGAANLHRFYERVTASKKAGSAKKTTIVVY